MLKIFKADLHVHTCLSPCGELEMSPMAIAARVSQKKIDILGVCDHNTTENADSIMKAARPYEISVFPGLEITSQEEVHILALFDELEPALKLQKKIYDNLQGVNDAEVFGLQVVVNEQGDVLHFNDHLLIGASQLPLEEIIQVIHSLGGLAIASHIDRPSFSLIAQLGFIPDCLDLDAVEISPQISREEAETKFDLVVPVTSFSDAHFLKDIGRNFTSFILGKPTTAEIKRALLNEAGREVLN